MARLLLTNADAFRVIAVGTERAGASRTDPLAAALMPALLLFEALFQGFHQLLPAAQRLDQLFLFLGQIFFNQLAQPLFRDHRGCGVDADHALEIGGEHQIIAVKEFFVLDQAGARQKIKILDTAECDLLLQRLDQHQKFLDRRRHPALAQLQEKINQHHILHRPLMN